MLLLQVLDFSCVVSLGNRGVVSCARKRVRIIDGHEDVVKCPVVVSAKAAVVVCESVESMPLLGRVILLQEKVVGP